MAMLPLLTACSLATGAHAAMGGQASSLAFCKTGEQCQTTGEPGEFCIPGALVCMETPPGLAPNLSGTGVEVCPAGTHAPQSSPACLRCEAGKYQAEAMRSACEACPAGKFADTAGSSKCTDASPGHIPNFPTAADAEVECPRGTFQRDAGKSECDACGAGKHALATGSTECVPARLGNGQHPNGTAAVASVIDGGASSCDNLTAKTCCQGMYWSKLMEMCELCPPGHWAVRSNDHCEACPIGTFQEAHGSTACKSCAGLGFADADRAIGCRKCYLFEHSPEEGSGETCQSCFDSVLSMFSHDCASMRFSICVLILFVVGGWRCARRLVSVAQELADAADQEADEADKERLGIKADRQADEVPLSARPTSVGSSGNERQAPLAFTSPRSVP